MRVEPLIPDAAPPSYRSKVPQSDAFGEMLDALGSVLGKAERAEDAFARGSGDLQRAVYERARADVALSVATATAQRAASTLQTILNMPV